MWWWWLYWNFIGLQFWKQNSRKVYAVPEEDLYREISGPRKRKRKEDDEDLVEKMTDVSFELERVNYTLTEMKGNLDKLFTISETTIEPISLKQLLSESFQCKICHVAPMKPPIIFGLCCKSIISCQKCVDLWYGVDREALLSKACPCCLTDRGYSQAVRLHGLDDLLKGVQPLFNNNATSDN